MSRTDFPLQSENYLSVGDSLRGLHCPQERARQRSLSGDLQANLIKKIAFSKMLLLIRVAGASLKLKNNFMILLFLFSLSF